MARKKSIKKRTRVIGEFEAQTTALLDGLWAEFAEAEEQHELGREKTDHLGVRGGIRSDTGLSGAPSGRPKAQHQRVGAGYA